MNIEDMTGQKSAAKLVKFDQVTLNGREGKLYYSHQTKEKQDDGFYQRDELSLPFQCVFLIRRQRYIKPSADGIKMYTDEFGDKNQIVKLYSEGKPQNEAPAHLLKDKYDLKSEVVQYIRYKGEVVRLRAKGLSIVPNEAKDTFYDYYFSFEEGENIWEYLTEITVTEEETKNGKFYRMKFARGAKLADEQIEEVKKQIPELYETLTKYEKTKHDGNAVLDAPQKPQEVDDVEDVNPDDIPF